MIVRMAKKPSRTKPGSKRSQGVDRHAQPRLAFHLPQSLHDAFKAHVEGLRPKPNESAVLREALEQYLGRVGAWPPPAADGD